MEDVGGLDSDRSASALGSFRGQKKDIFNSLDDELALFEVVLEDLRTEVGDRSISKPDTTLEIFESVWKRRGFKKHWRDHRGALGETVLNWVLFVPYEGEKETPRSHLLDDLLVAMLEKDRLVGEEDRLVEVPFKGEPFEGQTPLMQAVANGNVKFVDILLKNATDVEKMVNAEATGQFILSKVACPLSSVTKTKDVSVLEVAAVAPLSDEISFVLVKKLLDARANVNAGANGDASLLGRLASCAWRHGREVGELIPKKRVTELVKLAVDYQGHYVNSRLTLTPRTMARNTDRGTFGHSPLQEAAVAGHDNFIIAYLRKQEQVVWQWGHRRQVCIPLRELDHEPDDPDADVIELLVLHKHRETLCMVLFAEMISAKWQQFGRNRVVRELCLMICIVGIVTAACLPKSLNLSGATRPLRLIAFVVTLILFLYRIIYNVRAAWSCELFQKMNWIGTSARLGFDDCGRLRDLMTLALGIIVLAVHELETIIDVSHQAGLRQQTLIFLDGLSSLYVFTSWLGLLRYMQYFEETCVLVAVIPAIVKRDMRAWFIIYLGMVCSTALAMRVASWHTFDGTRPGDAVLGTPYQVAWTLEESTHGPDVHWRSIVMGQPMMCAAFFLAFLWLVTIIMFNLLIAIFSDSFDQRQRTASSELRFWQAVELVYYEKIMTPKEWYEQRLGHFRSFNLAPQTRNKSQEKQMQYRSGHPKPTDGEETPLLSQQAGSYFFAINEIIGQREWHNKFDARYGMTATKVEG